jgi:hypothetical protein
MDGQPGPNGENPQNGENGENGENDRMVRMPPPHINLHAFWMTLGSPGARSPPLGTRSSP